MLRDRIVDLILILQEVDKIDISYERTKYSEEHARFLLGKNTDIYNSLTETIMDLLEVPSTGTDEVSRCDFLCLPAASQGGNRRDIENWVDKHINQSLPEELVD
jgi:hypothetical protein